MKICILTTSYPTNSDDFAGHFVRTPAKMLAQQGHDVTVVAPDNANACPLHDDGVKLIRFRYSASRKSQRVAYGSGIIPNLKKSFLAKLQLPAFFTCFFLTALKASKYADIIHAHWSISGLVGLWCKLINKCPVLVHIHGSDLSEVSPPIVRRITGHVISKADGVITVSDKLHRLAMELNTTDTPVNLIRNGVDTNIFTPKHDRSIFKGTLAETALYTILFVGRLTDVKGPDIAIKLFKALLLKQTDCCLVFAGDGDMMTSLSETVNSDDKLKERVLFLGNTSLSKMPSLYQASDILIITSRSEGIPTCLYEAMSSGIPVASVAVGGIPEILKDGSNGILFKGNDPKEMAERLSELLGDKALRIQIGTNAREWAKKNCSWQKAIEDYLSFYKTITS